jgi:hypothetical protein
MLRLVKFPGWERVGTRELMGDVIMAVLRDEFP